MCLSFLLEHCRCSAITPLPQLSTVVSAANYPARPLSAKVPMNKTYKEEDFNVLSSIRTFTIFKMNWLFPEILIRTAMPSKTVAMLFLIHVGWWDSPCNIEHFSGFQGLPVQTPYNVSIVNFVWSMAIEKFRSWNTVPPVVFFCQSERKRRKFP